MDHNDDVGDMDDFFRMAHEEAMLETMSQGLVRGDQIFYIQEGRGDWTMKFKGVQVDKYHGKCDTDVGEWCAQHGMKKSFGVDFSTCSRYISKQLCDEWVRKMHFIRHAWDQNSAFDRTTNCLLGWEENPSITSMFQHATAHIKQRIVQLRHLRPHSY